jgi:hypothetical protein
LTPASMLTSSSGSNEEWVESGSATDRWGTDWSGWTSAFHPLSSMVIDLSEPILPAIPVCYLEFNWLLNN